MDDALVFVVRICWARAMRLAMSHFGLPSLFFIAALELLETNAAIIRIQYL